MSKELTRKEERDECLESADLRYTLLYSQHITVKVRVVLLITIWVTDPGTTLVLINISASSARKQIETMPLNWLQQHNWYGSI